MSEQPAKPRVLCVEDDAVTAILIRRGLERAGYHVEVVGSGEQALERFERETWSAVLIDQLLPDFSGLELLERMQELRALPATIMVSGRGNENVVATALKRGAHDYLVKDPLESYLELLPEVVARARRLVHEREAAIALAAERERLVAELTEALAKIKTLTGLLPICASCKSIRNGQGSWESLEVYLSAHSDAMLSHGLCPQCVQRYFPDATNKG